MGEDLSRCSILAVDDTKLNINVLVSVLGGQYALSVALDGESALRHVEENVPDLILLDIMMPGIDGIEVLRRLKNSDRTRDIPVLMLTALSETEQKAHCFASGAVDYIQKPFEVNELQARVRTHLSLALARKTLKEQNHNLEELVEQRTRELFVTQQAIIESMVALAEYRDPETGQHINRVKGCVELLAKKLSKHPRFAEQLPHSTINLFIRSAPLHDIGKVGVPDEILLKAGALTDEEFTEMKRHTEYGAQVILSVQKKVGAVPFLDVAREMACSHHEKWDGTGYPAGLSGENIPLSARIMALADVYDALISRRVYKPPFTHSKAVEIILQESGKSFDPDIVEAFSHCAEKIRGIALNLAESEEQRDALNN
ncbi:MAG: two-component system response regulator [Desulfobulbus propionicus]|nr:MAG: two-component system response regulator [Desulfobulbus propionicus]